MLTLLQRLFKVIAIIDLDGEVLLGQRGPSGDLTALALVKLLEGHKGSLVPTPWRRGGDGAGIEFKHIGANRIGRTSNIRQFHFKFNDNYNQKRWCVPYVVLLIMKEKEKNKYHRYHNQSLMALGNSQQPEATKKIIEP
jgi:hypothetical protein